MNSVRYIGLDVHRDTISTAVLDSEGKLVMQSALATRAAAILDFLHGITPGQALALVAALLLAAPGERWKTQDSSNSNISVSQIPFNHTSHEGRRHVPVLAEL